MRGKKPWGEHAALRQTIPPAAQTSSCRPCCRCRHEWRYNGGLHAHAFRRRTSMKALRYAFAFVPMVIAAQAGAAGFPERNITVIVPFPAGGASDTAARMVVPK